MSRPSPVLRASSPAFRRPDVVCCQPRASRPAFAEAGPPSVLRPPSSVLRPPSSAFSLIEVIIAVALFAAAVTVILALLPGLTRRGAENADRLVAQRLPDAVRTELTRLTLPGFDALAAQAPAMGAPPANGLVLVAPRDGSRVQARDYQPPAAGRIPEGEQYFLIECWRFTDGPLRYDAAQSSLALCVRVSWPYRQPGVNPPVPEAARQEFTFVTSLNR